MKNKYRSVDNGRRKCGIYTKKYYSAIKRNSFIYKQHSEPEGIIIPNEISQIKKDKYCMVSLICGILNRRS